MTSQQIRYNELMHQIDSFINPETDNFMQTVISSEALYEIKNICNEAAELMNTLTDEQLLECLREREIK